MRTRLKTRKTSRTPNLGFATGDPLPLSFPPKERGVVQCGELHLALCRGVREWRCGPGVSASCLLGRSRIRRHKAQSGVCQVRTIIIGVSDPYTTDPSHALSAREANSAGSRLYRMLVEYEGRSGRFPSSPLEYEDSFERLNLCVSSWDIREASRKVLKLALYLHGRRVLFLGNSVAGCASATLDFPRPPKWEWVRVQKHGFDCASVPHPSGRCRDYNELSNRLKTGSVLFHESSRLRHNVARAGGADRERILALG